MRTGLFIVQIDHLDNIDDYVDPGSSYACEALHVLVIEEDFCISNPDFLAKKSCDMYKPTASIAARSKRSKAEILKAKFDNIIGFAVDGYPVEGGRGLSGPAGSSDEEVIVATVTDEQRSCMTRWEELLDLQEENASLSPDASLPPVPSKYQNPDENRRK